MEHRGAVCAARSGRRDECSGWGAVHSMVVAWSVRAHPLHAPSAAFIIIMSIFSLFLKKLLRIIVFTIIMSTFSYLMKSYYLVE
jgi:hypothetical protein